MAVQPLPRGDLEGGGHQRDVMRILPVMDRKPEAAPSYTPKAELDRIQRQKQEERMKQRQREKDQKFKESLVLREKEFEQARVQRRNKNIGKVVGGIGLLAGMGGLGYLIHKSIKKRRQNKNKKSVK